MADFQVIGDCNNRCTFCFLPERLLHGEVADERTYDFLDKNKESDIYIGGGEPTLKENLPELLAYAQEHNPGATVHLVTNGRRLAYIQYVDTFRDLDRERFRFVIPVHGVEGIHDTLTQVPGSFGQTIRGLRNIEEYRLELRTVIHRQNYRDMGVLFSFLLKEKVEPEVYAIIMAKLTGIAFQNKEALLVSYRECVPYLERAILAQRGRLPFSLFHFPQCVLPQELRALSRGRTSNEVVFRDFCDSCVFRNNCSGIWPTTVRWGADEFRPVTEEDHKKEADLTFAENVSS